MYHPDIVEELLYEYRSLVVVRRDREECIAASTALNELLQDGKWTRELTNAEREFVRSEYILCKCDWRYFAERYGFTERDPADGGGMGPIKLWPSQIRSLELIGAKQKENWANFRKYGFGSGIFAVWHKSRQQAATQTARLMTMHRMVTHKNTRGLAVSIDDPRVLELYNRDAVVLKNLPFFLRPIITYDTKGNQLVLGEMNCRLSYQQSNQEAGIGVGSQNTMIHCTEMSTWRNASRIWIDMQPSIAQHPDTFCGFESTAFRKKGFWYEFTENIRKKEPGYEHWVYIFTPCYINDFKNRRVPREGWVPIRETVEYEALVIATSPEYAGRTVRPSQEHLFWWETEFLMHREAGVIHDFYANYPATPEQSFQHASEGALPIHVLERMRNRAVKGMPYELEYQR